MTRITSLFVGTFLLAALTTSVHAQQIGELTFDTAERYPYRLLVQLTDSVEVHYADLGDEGFRCYTTITDGETMRQTGKVKVRRSRFVKDALKACLPRKQAKEILSEVYNEGLQAYAATQ